MPSPWHLSFAPVAQLDRVSASEAEGRAFKSRQARHTKRVDFVDPLINTYYPEVNSSHTHLDPLRLLQLGYDNLEHTIIEI